MWGAIGISVMFASFVFISWLSYYAPTRKSAFKEIQEGWTTKVTYHGPAEKFFKELTELPKNPENGTVIVVVMRSPVKGPAIETWIYDNGWKDDSSGKDKDISTVMHWTFESELLDRALETK